MRRIQYHRYGGPETMRLEEFQLGEAEAGQIVVRTKAASANPVDWKIRNGVMKFMTGFRFPRAMGCDFSGVVEAVGPSVTRIKVGDEVLGSASMKNGGAFADKLIVAEELVVVKPSALLFVQAAALPIVGATAWCGLIDKAQLKPGQSVFIHGCLGGVGRAATQLAMSLGANVVGSCRGAAMVEAGALGLHRVVDYQRFDVDLLKRQFDIVFDTAGTLSLEEGRALLKPDGVVLDINPSPSKLFGIMLSRRHRMVVAKPTPYVLAKVADMAAIGQLLPSIGKTVSLSDAIPALTVLEQLSTPKGKLVITWN